MLQILVNNTPLVLDPKTKIRLEMNTSYFDVDEIKGDVVWHFDIPALGNEETFNYANFITVRNKFKYYSCIITLHSIPIGRGQMVISKSTNKIFRVAVSLNSFCVDFDGVSLKDAPYTEERIGGDPHTEAAVLQHAKDVNSGTIERDYRFPTIYAPQFYGNDKSFDHLVGEHPEFNTDYLRYINNWVDGDFVTNEISNGQSMVPLPILVPVIQKLLSSKAYSLSGALVQEEYLKDLLLYSNESLDYFLSDYKVNAQGGYLDNPDSNRFYAYTYYAKFPFQIILEDNFDCYLGSTYLVRETANYHINVKIQPWGGWERDLKHTKPVHGKAAIFKGDEILYEVAYDYLTSDGYPPYVYLIGDFDLTLDDTITIKVMSTDSDGVSDHLIDRSLLTIYKNVDTPGRNVHKNKLSLNDHIPDIKISSLLNSLRNAFFMAVFFDDENKVVETELLKDVLSNTNYVDVTNHVVYDSSEVIPEESNSIQLQWEHVEELNDIEESKLLNNVDYNNDLIPQFQKTYAFLSGSNAVYVFDLPHETASEGEWMFYRHNYRSYGNKDAKLKPSIKVCPVPTMEVDNKIFPYSLNKGVSHKVPDSDDVGVQLLHWYGVLDVPYASPLANREGNEVLGPLCIDFNRASGIVPQLGQEWLSFIAKSEEFKVLLTKIDIWKLLEIQSLFLPKRKANHPRWVLANNVKALPKQFTAEMDISGKITASELVLVKKSE
ncbi:hypothetical protein E9993_14595 [Labilibacter sediminis]|nr:hypothetical protein E9993_14595 [Labilibacter sediminis]